MIPFGKETIGLGYCKTGRLFLAYNSERAVIWYRQFQGSSCSSGKTVADTALIMSQRYRMSIGEIFFLDIFDLGRLPDYKQSVAEYAKDHPDDNYKRSSQYEFYIPREYWDSLQGSLAGIKEIKVTDKIGGIDNEINRYRYDEQVTVEKGRDVDGARQFKPQFGVRQSGESVSLTGGSR